MPKKIGAIGSVIESSFDGMCMNAAWLVFVYGVFPLDSVRIDAVQNMNFVAKFCEFFS